MGNQALLSALALIPGQATPSANQEQSALPPPPLLSPSVSAGPSASEGPAPPKAPPVPKASPVPKAPPASVTSSSASTLTPASAQPLVRRPSGPITHYLGADERERQMLIPDTLEREPVSEKEKELLTQAHLDSLDKEKLKKILLEICPASKKAELGGRLSALSFEWKKSAEMRLDTEAEGSYAGNPARAVEGKIFFNIDSNDYYNSDGTINTDKLLSTIVHETLHYSSALPDTSGEKKREKSGFQDKPGLFTEYGAGTPSQDQPDEAMTDYLAYEVYHRMYPEKEYDTGYWCKSQSSDVPFLQPNATLQERMKNRKLRGMAKKGCYPTAWTGDMVPIMLQVLNSHRNKEERPEEYTLEDLKEWYFSNPSLFFDAFKDEELKNEVATLWKERKWEAFLSHYTP